VNRPRRESTAPRAVLRVGPAGLASIFRDIRATPRNAVSSLSVKVGAAPDTPSWGQVLARHLPRGRLDRRARPVTFCQLSGHHLSCGHPEQERHDEPGVGRGQGRASPAVWSRSGTCPLAAQYALSLRRRAADQAPGRGTRNGACRGDGNWQNMQYLGPADSPGRDTGSTGRHRGRRPLPGKDPS
jgi:hypothetical protein